MNKEYKFKGYDYWELVECFWEDLKHDDLTDDGDSFKKEEIMIERLSDYLRSEINVFSVNKNVCNKVREYINAFDHMCRKYDFNQRYIVEGLKNTKDDVTFIEYTLDLIWRLWN